MSFIDRLIHEEDRQLQARMVEQKRLKANQPDIENERKRAQELKALAQGFYVESGVGVFIDKLASYLARPTIEYYESISNDGGWGEPELRHRGRGSSGFPAGREPALEQTHPNGFIRGVHWDSETTGEYHDSHAYKYIAVITNPDGCIEFLGKPNRFLRSGGSTRFELPKWRSSPNRDKLFDQALEKAFKNPLIHSYKTLGYGYGFG